MRKFSGLTRTGISQLQSYLEEMLMLLKISQNVANMHHAIALLQKKLIEL